MHAFEIETFWDGKQEKVRFGIHPLQRRTQIVIHCVADVLGRRLVSDSGGHEENRILIQTFLKLGGITFPIEITLTNRDDMMFRMLLGRTALRERLIVDSSLSYQMGRDLRRYYRKQKEKVL